MKLYNILFPIWLFWIFPTYVWMIILPINFLLDSLVVLWMAKRNHVELSVWKKSILNIWIIGFVSDIVGALLILLLMIGIDFLNFPWDTMHFPGTTLMSIPGVILAGILIYHLNRKMSFMNCNIDENTVKKISMALAIFTAPYAMLIPLYG